MIGRRQAQRTFVSLIYVETDDRSEAPDRQAQCDERPGAGRDGRTLVGVRDQYIGLNLSVALPLYSPVRLSLQLCS